LGEIVATTIESRTRELADNVSNSNAVLAKLSARGKIKPVSGGNVIFQELQYAENSTFLYYSGYDPIFTTPSTAVIDTAEYSWKQAAVTVAASGLEINIQNTGKERLIDLLEGRISNAFKTMANQISAGIYSNGTGTSGKQITGLQAQVADAPVTGTVGGINRATGGNEWWRNQATVTSAAITADNIQGHMKKLYLLCTRGPDVPDLMPADSALYTLYWDSLTAIQRITREDQGKLGWQNLMFVNAEVVYDGDSGIAAEHMYFLNTDFLFWRPHTDVNMVADTKRITYDGDSFIVPILFAGNMTMSNASLQGVLVDGS
jgi:hypothetical protein